MVFQWKIYTDTGTLRSLKSTWLEKVELILGSSLRMRQTLLHQSCSLIKHTYYLFIPTVVCNQPWLSETLTCTRSDTLMLHQPGSKDMEQRNQRGVGGGRGDHRRTSHLLTIFLECCGRQPEDTILHDIVKKRRSPRFVFQFQMWRYCTLHLITVSACPCPHSPAGI